MQHASVYFSEGHQDDGAAQNSLDC